MQTTVHVLGFLLLVSGCAGILMLTVQAATSLCKSMDKRLLQPELASTGSPPSAPQRVHQRLPFVLKP